MSRESHLFARADMAFDLGEQSILGPEQGYAKKLMGTLLVMQFEYPLFIDAVKRGYKEGKLNGKIKNEMNFKRIL